MVTAKKRVKGLFELYDTALRKPTLQAGEGTGNRTAFAL